MNICQKSSGRVSCIWKEIGPDELFPALTVLGFLTFIQASHELCKGSRVVI